MNNDHNLKSIKDILQKVFKQSDKLSNGMQQLDVTEAWKNVMGNGVWTYTSSLKITNGNLTIYLKSATLREELSYGKEKIIGMLNEYLKKDVVKKIRLI